MSASSIARHALPWVALAAAWASLFLCSMASFGANQTLVTLTGSACPACNGVYVPKSMRFSGKAGSDLEHTMAQLRVAPHSHVPDVWGLGALTAPGKGVMAYSKSQDLWLVMQPDGPAFAAPDAAGAGTAGLPPSEGWRNVQNAPADLTATAHPASLGWLRWLDPASAAARRSPALMELAQKPVNTALFLLCIAVWFLLWQRRAGYDTVGYSYKAVVEEGQYWRAMSATVAHIALLHLVMNMASLYNLGALEQVHGSLQYLANSYQLALGSMAVISIIYRWIIVRRGMAQYRQVHAVGYSCVLFGLMVDACARAPRYCPIPGLDVLCLPTYRLPLGGGVTLALNGAPFVLLFVIQLILPQVSFVGHLAGIVIGYPLSWGALRAASPSLLTKAAALVILLLETRRRMAYGPEPSQQQQQQQPADVEPAVQARLQAVARPTLDAAVQDLPARAFWLHLPGGLYVAVGAAGGWVFAWQLAAEMAGTVALYCLAGSALMMAPFRGSPDAYRRVLALAIAGALDLVCGTLRLGGVLGAKHVLLAAGVQARRVKFAPWMIAAQLVISAALLVASIGILRSTEAGQRFLPFPQLWGRLDAPRVLLVNSVASVRQPREARRPGGYSLVSSSASPPPNPGGGRRLGSATDAEDRVDGVEVA